MRVVQFCTLRTAVLPRGTRAFWPGALLYWAAPWDVREMYDGSKGSEAVWAVRSCVARFRAKLE